MVGHCGQKVEDFGTFLSYNGYFDAITNGGAARKAAWPKSGERWAWDRRPDGGDLLPCSSFPFEKFVPPCLIF